MPADVSASLPDLDLAPLATLTVDTGDPSAVVTGLVVFGTYYPKGKPPEPDQQPLWLPLPAASG